jgi:cell division septation protein DedD
MNVRDLIVAALLLAAPAPLVAEPLKDGIEAWQSGDYAAAVAIWRPLAEKGDADAAFNLGQAYRLGRGIPANAALAQSWFEKAANQGHVDAATMLGLLLIQKGDQPGAIKWLKRAAEKDEPRAQLVYGTALYNGDGVTQDPVLGYAFVSRAAGQGLEPAQQTLAQLDKLMSADDRRKGAAMVKTIAENASTAAFEGAPPPKAEKPPRAAAAKPVRTTVATPPKPAPSPPASAEPVRMAVAAPPAKPRPSPAAAKPAPTTVAAAPAKPPPSSSAAPPVAAGGAWRVQLGAFARQGSAQALYEKLAGNGALAGRRPFYVPAGAVTRLQVGPFASRGAAESACAKLKGQPCFAVSAK